MQMRLAWLDNTRPECLLEISKLTQVTVERFEQENSTTISRFNKAIKFAVYEYVALKNTKVDIKSLRVARYSNASFANSHDMSTQLGHINFLTDNFNASVLIQYKSYRSTRVVRSAVSGEFIAFSELFDRAMILASELEAILSRGVPVQLLTDSESLFNVKWKGSRIREKRTILKIATEIECFRDKLIDDIGLVRSNRKIADGLTKSISQAAL